MSNHQCQNSKYHGDEKYFENGELGDDEQEIVFEYFPVFNKNEEIIETERVKTKLNPIFEISMEATDRLAKHLAELRKNGVIYE